MASPSPLLLEDEVPFEPELIGSKMKTFNTKYHQANHLIACLKLKNKVKNNED